jgi:hypothetical protein
MASRNIGISTNEVNPHIRDLVSEAHSLDKEAHSHGCKYQDDS